MNTQAFDRARRSVYFPDIAANLGLSLKRVGSEWRCLCPFHNEKTASFSIFPGKDSVARYHCFGCGARGDVVDLVMGMRSCSNDEALAYLGEGSLPAGQPEHRQSVAVDPYAGIKPLWFDAFPFQPGVTSIERVLTPKTGKSMTFTPVSVHPYRLRDGRLVGVVLRRDFTDPDTGQRRKEVPTIRRVRLPTGDETWARYPFGKGRHPYGIETVGDAREVVVVEGEKAADALRRRIPLPVVTWAGGTKAIHLTDWRTLKGSSLIIWPDADAPGMAAARWLRDNFAGKATILELPGVR
jgi:hypothetical protein